MNSLRGHLLIATPQLLDSNFVKTVLLIFEHTVEGAAGVILNRATEMTVADVSGQLLETKIDWDKTIHLGGPVPGPLMALHTEPSLADRGAMDGVYLTVEQGKISELLRRQVEPSLILANYAGWGPDQLERELAEGSWYHIPARIEHLFGEGNEELWETMVRGVRRGRITDLLGIVEVPEDPSMN